MAKKNKITIKSKIKKEIVSDVDLPPFFKDKMETLSGISKLTPAVQQSIYRDAVRLVQYCKNPVRLWHFQRLSTDEQCLHLPGLYKGYSARSRKRVFGEAKLYMYHLTKQRPTGVVRTFLNRLKRR